MFAFGTLYWLAVIIRVPTQVEENIWSFKRHLFYLETRVKFITRYQDQYQVYV